MSDQQNTPNPNILFAVLRALTPEQAHEAVQWLELDAPKHTKQMLRVLSRRAGKASSDEHQSK